MDTKKILITGFNALTVGSARSPLNIATSAKILPKVLKEAGYDVVQKAIIPGEDVSQYDKVIVYVFGPNSLSARYCYGAMYTIIKRPDAIISIDDWQTKESVSGFGTFSRGHWRIWKKFSQAGNNVEKRYWNEAQDYKKEIEDLVDHFAFKEWPHDLLVPAYDGGRYEALGLKARNILNWDPSPYTDSYKSEPKNLFDVDVFTPDYEKKLEWIMASLLNKSTFVDRLTLQWPIQNFGNIKLEQPRLKEHELYERYKKSWGILSPPHYHTLNGSGWWRVRYKMVHDSNSILVGDLGETSLFGKAYEKTPNDVEAYFKRYGAQGLARLRDEQKIDFKNKTWTKEKCIKFFKDYLK